jgi:DNA-binding MarR family transcriptional regulator
LFEKKADELLREHFDLGFAQYKVLEAIGRNTNAKQNTIADLLDQTEASISRQIKILSRRKLISVDAVMGNKRARELNVMPQGEEQLRLCRERLDVLYARVFAGVSEEDVRYFEALFDRLITNVRS